MDIQNAERLIALFYPEDTPLKRLLLRHSEQVQEKALEIAKLSGVEVDVNVVAAGAMLHDIGIFRCKAAGIQCYGTEPYICHGTIGAQLLLEQGFPQHARVCERHTGAGITERQIVEQNFPIPPRDLAARLYRGLCRCWETACGAGPSQSPG